MIHGRVEANGEIFFRVAVADRHGDLHDFTALLDTGFTGYLTLTPELIEALGIILDEEIPVIVGDGTIQTFRRYKGEIVWAGREINGYIHAVSGIPVIGLELLRGGKLYVECTEGGTATFDFPPA